ncbi:hypothetical protein VYU27_010785, partial [Nannochloropsis oceanica]
KEKHWSSELTKLRKAHQDDLDSDPALNEEEKAEEEDEEEEEEEEEGGERRARPPTAAQQKAALALPVMEEEELQAVDKDALKYRINLLEQERDRLRENVNMRALVEYRQKEKEYKKRLAELDTATDVR